MKEALRRCVHTNLRNLQCLSCSIRCLHTTSLRPERQRAGASSPPADDYYSLLLSSPLPSNDPPSKAPTPPGPRNTSSQSPLTTSTKPPGPRNTSTNTPPRDTRVIFGSRLAGPAAAREQQGWAEARPKEPDNCCMSGCVNCVWDLYREEMEEWAARQRKAHSSYIAGEADKARKMRGRGKRKEGDVQGEGGVGDSDDGGIGSYEGVDVAQEGLFEGVPVGIREFMNTEKRLRERRETHQRLEPPGQR